LDSSHFVDRLPFHQGDQIGLIFAFGRQFFLKITEADNILTTYLIHLKGYILILKKQVGLHFWVIFEKNLAALLFTYMGSI
jgi:hypothetical protein